MADKKEFIKDHLTDKAPEGCTLKVGDLVEWVNDYGAVWQHKIIGFNYNRWFNEEYKCFVHLDTASYWFPHNHNTLTKINK